MNKNLVNKKKKKGFTLIELIIVIAIIAILAAIAIPKFGEVKDSANKKSDIANAKTIATAVTTLLADNPTESGLTGVVAEDGKVAEYIQNLPEVKSNSKTNFYVAITDGKVSVSICTTGATADDLIEAYPTPTSKLK